jgi:hypothetical protein
MKNNLFVKFCLISIGILGILLTSAVVAYVVFICVPSSKKYKEAIRIAESLSADRLAKLISDSKDLAKGKRFSLAPRTDDVFMWGDDYGYPAEFADIKPLRIYVSDDEVIFETFKVYDSFLWIVVLKPKSMNSMVILREDSESQIPPKILYRKTSLQ